MLQQYTIFYYSDIFTNYNLRLMDNQALFNLCFADFSNNDWGFGSKRIGIKIPGTITDKYCFTGFGFKDKTKKLFIGLRMWKDQGDFTEMIPYNNNYNINQHFIELIQKFNCKYY